jgi:hypothetical protein
MAAIHDFLGNQSTILSWDLIAQQRRIRFDEIFSRRDELERQLLVEFLRYVRARPQARWLHWNLSSEQYGFHALAERMKRYGLQPPDIGPHNSIGLSQVLKEKFGEDYVPHERLRSLIRLNHLNDFGLLDCTAKAAAYRAGSFSLMRRSLSRKVECLRRIFELACTGRLLVGDPSCSAGRAAGQPQLTSDPAKEPTVGGERPFPGDHLPDRPARPHPEPAAANSPSSSRNGGPRCGQGSGGLPQPQDQEEGAGQALDSAGPGCSEQAKRRRVTEGMKLTDRQEVILVTMLKMGATCESGRQTQETIVKRINPKDATAGYKRAFAGLTRRELTGSRPSADGGMWLTDKGMRVAEHISKPDR